MVRDLGDGEFQLEDVATRRITTVRGSTILNRVWDRTYSLILHGQPAPSDQAGSTPHLIAPDLGSLSSKDVEVIDKRSEYVKAIQAAHVSRGQRSRIAPIIKMVAARRREKAPSSSTVMAWMRSYARADNCMYALVSGNNRRRSARRLSPLMDALISKTLREVYFTLARHTLQHAMDRIKAAAEMLVSQGRLKRSESSVSLSTLSRRVRTVDLYHRVATRYGPARARMVCRTAFNGPTASMPLEQVEIDHTMLNWVVICDRTGLPLGRPILTVMIDSYSGYLLGFYLSFHGPGVTSLSGVLQNAIKPKDDFMQGIKTEHPWLACGVPDMVVVDNGLEFHANAFKRMSWELGFHLTYCRVRTPWLKPHVERFFGSLNNLTLVRGRVRQTQANVIKVDPQKDAAISFSALVEGLAMFAADVYPFQINERKLARPYDLFVEGIERSPPVAFPASWEQLRLAAAMSKEVTVGPGGVQLLGLPFGDGDLLPMKKALGNGFKALVKWDPDDLQCVYVQDPTSKSWVTAPCRWREYAQGLSWTQHRIIRDFARQKLQACGAEEELLRARLRLHEHWANATSLPRRADAVQYARFSGVTSARIAPPSTDVTPPEPECVVLPLPEPKPTQVVEEEIPDFEIFYMD